MSNKQKLKQKHKNSLWGDLFSEEDGDILVNEDVETVDNNVTEHHNSNYKSSSTNQIKQQDLSDVNAKDSVENIESLTEENEENKITIDDIDAQYDLFDEPFTINTQARDGFRLQRFEFYNWGTFHDINKVFTLNLNNENYFLTGQVGSGKSSIIDAITTLLVDPKKIIYNKAAGEESKSRTLLTYVKGYYAAEKNESSGLTKPKFHRDRSHYSAILGLFYCESLRKYVTLAQIFTQNEEENKINRTYFVLEGKMSIRQISTHIGKDASQIVRKVKKSVPTVQVFDSYNKYNCCFRQLFDVSDQGLDLFNQTVSMKSVPNITDFVRTHMLKTNNIDEIIDPLIQNFNDLNTCYKNVKKAQEQLKALEPIKTKGLEYQELVNTSNSIQHAQESCDNYFNKLKYDLTNNELIKLINAKNRLDNERTNITTKLDAKNNEINQLNKEFGAKGGNFIDAINNEIDKLKISLTHCLKDFQNYEDNLKIIKSSAAKTEKEFYKQKDWLETKAKEINDDISSTEENLNKLNVENYELLKNNIEPCKVEIASLQTRKNNIPNEQVRIRSLLCENLNLSDEDIPFIGELIEVIDSEKLMWEGAIEKVLRNLALSLLIPAEHYNKAVQFIDKCNLNGRVVYYQVPKTLPKDLYIEIKSASLVNKINIKKDLRFKDYIFQKLAKSFNYTCTEDYTEFCNLQEALTRNGQYKQKNGRHEKDDRVNIFDRTRYVLGWSNESKLKALQEELQKDLLAYNEHSIQIKNLGSLLKSYHQKITAIEQLNKIESFTNIDTQYYVKEINRKEIERDEFLKSNDQMNLCQLAIDKAMLERKELELTKEDIDKKIGINSNEIEKANENLEICKEFKDAVISDNAIKIINDIIDVIKTKINRKLTYNTIDDFNSKTKSELNQKFTSLSKKKETAGINLCNKITEFCDKYREDTLNIVRDSAESYKECIELYNNIERDGLPNFVKKFKDKLTTESFVEIQNLSAHFDRDEKLIRDQIDTINESLKNIEYTPDTYIKLNIEQNKDLEIIEFKNTLKNCSTNTFSYEEDLSILTQKFEIIKNLITRLAHNSANADADLKWRKKVTDIRRWFIFSASEQLISNDVQVNLYEDSSGKSGGQKEKLAYTILSASLAYQYDNARYHSNHKGFKFVIIDEAFGKGSEESAQFALDLFKSFGLQLLVATPLAKVKVIENYVKTIGFVECKEFISNMMDIPIEDYYQRYQRRINQ